MGDPAARPLRIGRFGGSRIAAFLLLALAVAALLGTLLRAGSSSVPQARSVTPQPPPTGETLYQAACAACHGSDGTGAPRERVGFEVPLPDFTDCSFASREPDDDWLAVVHDGGRARAFDPMMPAFGEALNENEIRLALAHIRTFCRNDSWPRGELNLPRALVTEKAFPEDEAVWTTTVNTSGSGAVLNEVVYERRFGARNHVELAVPFGAREGDAGDWTGGVGDVALGVKRVLHHSFESGTILSAIGEVNLPTGSSKRGFGKGVAMFEPSVALGQILPADAFFQFQGGFELSTNTNRAEHEAFWRTVAGRTFTQGRFGRAWSPMVEALGWRELAEGHRVRWDLVPQMQVTLNTRQHVMLNVGVRIPVSDRDGRSTSLAVYLLWDWFDGGLFEGW
jgi:hypothetical protein